MLGLGLTWGVMWSAVLATLALIIGVFDPDSIDPGEGVGMMVKIGMTVGFVSGAFFGAVLSFAEGRKTFGELSLWRIAIWGAIGAAILPLATTMNNTVLLNTIPLGVISALVTVGIARRASLPPAADSDTPLVGTPRQT